VSESPAVELDRLTHKYGDRTALDGLNLRIKRGMLFALLGPNGGGKTTLFKILATLMPPMGGTARVAGGNVVSDRRHVRGRIGIVFQKPSLDGKLTVAENIMHQGHLYGLRGGQLSRRSGPILERFGLSDRVRDRVDTLSGGLQRRVELAKALLHQPEVLILDEPSTGLDPSVRADLGLLLSELRREREVTILLTTHLMEEADECDRIGILDGGRLVAEGTSPELKSAIRGDVILATGAKPVELAARIASRFACETTIVDGAVRMERDRGHEFVPALIEAFPGEISGVSVGKPTLGDVFLHVAGHRWREAEPEANERR